MNSRPIERGRLIDHIGLVVKDLKASRRFYETVLQVLDVPLGGSTDDGFWAHELFVSAANSSDSQARPTGRHHIAFQAANRATVDAVYMAALENGCLDNGPPGERAYHRGYYAAFVLDPDGNNIEVVHHGENQRTTKSATITYRSEHDQVRDS